MAAGHRPCAECRYQAFTQFRDHWLAANRALLPQRYSGIKDIDHILHNQRINSRQRTQITYTSHLDQLPNSTFVTLEDQTTAYLVWGDGLFAWSAKGYGQQIKKTTGRLVTVLTPRSTVKTLTAGYVPEIHPSLV